MLRLLALLLLLLPTAPAAAAVRCEVVEATEILGRTAGLNAPTLDFESDAGFRLRLVMDADQLDIANPAFAGQLFPVDAARVRAALAEMDPLPGFPIDVRIYCLPGFPQDVGRSFAVGREIFLAPGFGEVPFEVVAYTVVHELGHVVQHHLMPGRTGERWRAYLEQRDLTDRARYHESAPHRDRPGEIFAEDFRALYGGPTATYSGTIENQELPLPADVEGLPEFMSGLFEGLVGGHGVHVANHPNPFNPSTSVTIQLRAATLAAADRVEIAIVDARGRRLRHFPAQPAAARIRLDWDGRDDRGQTVASGSYFCVVRAGDATVSRAMTLLK